MKLYNNFQLNKKDIEKGLKLPAEISIAIAEFIGIHFGDGSMSNKGSNKYRIYYSFNLRDIEYAEYVRNLIYSIFNINIKLGKREKKHEVYLYAYSKNLCTFLNTSLQIPYSPKKQLIIPDYIKYNQEYLKSFLKGLFDTDGCIIIQKDGKYSYVLIKITTSIKMFADDIKSALNSLNINSYICIKSNNVGIQEVYDIVIRRKESVDRFITFTQPKIKRE